MSNCIDLCGQVVEIRIKQTKHQTEASLIEDSSLAVCIMNDECTVSAGTASPINMAWRFSSQFSSFIKHVAEPHFLSSWTCSEAETHY